MYFFNIYFPSMQENKNFTKNSNLEFDHMMLLEQIFSTLEFLTLIPANTIHLEPINFHRNKIMINSESNTTSRVTMKLLICITCKIECTSFCNAEDQSS